MTDASQIPPGWYADTENPGTQRWWNGLGWTDDRRPHPAAPASPAAAPAYPSAPSYPAYPTAPAATPERRDIPTNTPWIWLVVLLPILSVLPLFFVDWTGYIQELVRDSLENPTTAWVGSFTGVTLLITLLSYVVIAAQILFAWLDWRALKARGIDRPFHWAWIFFTLVVSNGVYVIGRGVILRRQTGKGLLPVWIWIAVNVLGIVVGIGFAIFFINALVTLMPSFEQYSNR